MEDNKKLELTDEQLDTVSGGGCYYEENVPNCPNCGTKMSFGGHFEYYAYYCDACNHMIVIEP